MPTLASNKYCTGCLVCKDSCPRRAISVLTKNGMPYVQVDPALCIECHACERACPIITPQRKNHVEDMRAYGGWAIDERVRFSGASGGAFSAIALAYMRMHAGNVAVYGAMLENNHVRHERVTTKEELHKLANSKYIQSNTDGIYRQVRDDIRNGLFVLFSGTPCQVAALYAYLGSKRDTEQLLTIEVVCHGVASQDALDIHLKQFHSDHIYSFRNKEEGQSYELSYKTTIERNGKPYRLINGKDNDVFHCIYACRLLTRSSCSNCQYASLNRVADITIADFWGNVRNREEYQKGVSSVVANNVKANNILRETSELHLYGTTLAKTIAGNPHFYDGFSYLQYHPIAKWGDFFRNHLTDRMRLNILQNKQPWRLLWGLFRLADKLRIRRVQKKLQKKYGKLLNTWHTEETY